MSSHKFWNIMGRLTFGSQHYIAQGSVQETVLHNVTEVIFYRPIFVKLLFSVS